MAEPEGFRAACEANETVRRTVSSKERREQGERQAIPSVPVWRNREWRSRRGSERLAKQTKRSGGPFRARNAASKASGRQSRQSRSGEIGNGGAGGVPSGLRSKRNGPADRFEQGTPRARRAAGNPVSPGLEKWGMAEPEGFEPSIRLFNRITV